MFTNLSHKLFQTFHVIRSSFLRGKPHDVKSGFTFVELLIAIGVVAAMAGFVLLNYPSAQRKARDTQRKSDIKQYQTSLEAYANRNNNLYPAASGNMTIHCGVLGLAVCPDDPRGVNNYAYVVDGSAVNYYIWIELEQPDASGNTEYYVLCSNGVTDTMITTPSGASCPI